MSESCPEAFLRLAAHAADAARGIVRDACRRPPAVEHKADRTPVTAVDREVEAALRRLVAEAFPAHGVLGEELPAERRDAEYLWVIDPIDGTQAFVCGIPVFATLIALLHRGRPLLGICEYPATRERCIGARGHPTTHDGAPVRTRPCPGLAEAWLCATTPEMFHGADAAAFARLRGQARTVRYGADAYAYGLLARGRVDLVAEADLAPHDYLAHVPVVEGAGGVISDWQGRPLTLTGGASRVLAAGDPALHAQALRLLGAAPA